MLFWFVLLSIPFKIQAAPAMPIPCAGNNFDVKALGINSKYNDCINQTLPNCTIAKNNMTYSVVQTIVSNRLNNLYQGYNGEIAPTTAPNPKYLLISGSKKGAQSPLGLALTTGTCDQVGACNLFCGEGSTGGVKVKYFPKSINESQNGFQQNGLDSMTRLYLPLSEIPDDNILSSLPYANPNPSDFTAKGVLTVPSPSPPNPLPNSTWGWPVLSCSDTNYGHCNSSSCNSCATSSPGQHRVSNKEWYHTNAQFVGCDMDMGFYYLDSFTSSQQPGGYSSGCSSSVSVDYKNATAMQSIQVGVWVQATWMMLQEVANEINTSGGLQTISPICLTQTKSIEPFIRNHWASLGGGSSNNSFDTALSLLCSSGNSDPSNNDAQLSQYSTALSKTISSILQESMNQNVFACEVYQRAQNLYEAATMTGKDSNGNNSSSWMEMLKHWAFASCMAYRGDPYSQKGLESTAAITSFTKLGGAFNAVGSGISSIFGGPTISYPDYPDYAYFDYTCSKDDFQKEICGRYSSVQNCFPYAYTALLKQYLMNPPTGFKPFTPVPLQGLNSQGDSLPTTLTYIDANSTKTITIVGCQMSLPKN